MVIDLLFLRVAAAAVLSGRAWAVSAGKVSLGLLSVAAAAKLRCRAWAVRAHEVHLRELRTAAAAKCAATARTVGAGLICLHDFRVWTAAVRAAWVVDGARTTAEDGERTKPVASTKRNRARRVESNSLPADGPLAVGAKRASDGENAAV